MSMTQLNTGTVHPRGMDDTTRRVVLFSTFSYMELPTFRHEATQTLQRQWRSWRMARGESPVEDNIKLINGSPQPASRFAYWHKSQAGMLVTDAATCHRQGQLGWV